ncbi:MAG TPA: MFS transporter [Xanthobacteraceae bacterium]|nr:MFS transporter [Xanthobacteraceae bacterium]
MNIGNPVVAKASPKLFYGWLVVAGGFAVTFIGFGCVYSFSAFIDSLQHDFGASRGSVSLVFSLAGFLYFAIGMVSGPLADRFSSRRVALIGMILIGVGLALASAAHSLAGVYAGYGLGIGLGVGFSYVPAMGAVQRWFIKHRGFASGLASSGIGAGTLVVPPFTALLIDHLGWREAYLALGIIAAILGIGAALLLENDPRDRGLLPDGDSKARDLTTHAPQPAAVHAPAAGLSIAEAVRSKRFLGLYAACLFCAFGVFVPFVHLTPYAIDHGIAKSSAVFLISMIGIGSTVGRFCLGGLADRLGRRFSLKAMFAGMAASLLIWALSTTFWPLAVFAFVFGTAYGGWVALLPSVVMDYFGGRNVSGIIGVLYTSAGIGTLIGPSAAGFAFDIGGSYTIPILLSAAGNVIAVLIMASTAEAADETPAAE